MTRPSFKVLNGGRSEEPRPPIADPDCWLLLPNRDNPSEARAESKLAGLPYWPQSEAWPPCRGCGRPLDFILQIRSDAAHRLFPGPMGVLVLLYCLHCRPFYDAGQQRFAVSASFRPRPGSGAFARPARAAAEDAGGQCGARSAP